MSCECGLSYVEGLAEDEELHTRLHAEYEWGPSLPVIAKVEQCGQLDGLGIHEINRSCNRVIRAKLAYVAMVAHRSMPDYKSGYDGTVTEDDQRLYLLADGSHIAAMVLTCLDSYYWRLRWRSDDSVELVSETRAERHSPKVARVWVANHYRGRSLGPRLVQFAGASLKCGPADIGWEIPLTAGGVRLVKRLAPTDWWGSGDVFALEETLGVRQPRRARE
jgi:hypothetical protein